MPWSERLAELDALSFSELCVSVCLITARQPLRGEITPGLGAEQGRARRNGWKFKADTSQLDKGPDLYQPG